MGYHFIVFNWYRNVKSALNMFYVSEHLIIMTDKAEKTVELLGNDPLPKMQEPQRLILRSNKSYSRWNCLQTRFLSLRRNLKLSGMEFDTASCKSDKDSSLLQSFKHVLHVISYLNLNLNICCTCKD